MKFIFKFGLNKYCKNIKIFDKESYLALSFAIANTYRQILNNEQEHGSVSVRYYF